MGNYYVALYHDAQNAIEQAVPVLPNPERETLVFVRAFCDSDLPQAIADTGGRAAPDLATGGRAEDDIGDSHVIDRAWEDS